MPEDQSPNRPLVSISSFPFSSPLLPILLFLFAAPAFAALQGAVAPGRGEGREALRSLSAPAATAAQTGQVVVNNLRDDYMWADHNLSAIQDRLIEGPDGQLHFERRDGPIIGPAG
eukprot:9483262-Pyramimonas_sp.AAC.1